MGHKKSEQLFRLKSKNPYLSYVIYEATCVCNKTCIDETRRNTQIRWDVHEDPKKDPVPVKHLRNHPGY